MRRLHKTNIIAAGWKQHESCFGAIFKCDFDVPISRPSVESEFIPATRETAQLFITVVKIARVLDREIVEGHIVDAIPKGASGLGTRTG